MSIASAPPSATGLWKENLDPFCCPSCAGRLMGSNDALSCTGCGKSYPIRDGILVVKDRIDSNNQVAQGVLRQPALAQIPVLGALHLDLQRR